MAAKMKTDCFIQMMGAELTLLAYKHGYNVASPIIAQSILESGWGSSMLSDVYNYFGMKANSRWNGPSVEMRGEKWRKYSSLMDGLEGYFVFIEISRYDPLRAATDYVTYCNELQKTGYCPSETYPSNLIRIIQQYGLTRFDDMLNCLKKGI